MSVLCECVVSGGGFRHAEHGSAALGPTSCLSGPSAAYATMYSLIQPQQTQHNTMGATIMRLLFQLRKLLIRCLGPTRGNRQHPTGVRTGGMALAPCVSTMANGHAPCAVPTGNAKCMLTVTWHIGTLALRGYTQLTQGPTMPPSTPIVLFGRRVILEASTSF